MDNNGAPIAGGDTPKPIMPRVVVGVDGSAISMRALAWAAAEAALRGASLEIVHATFFRHELLEQFEEFASGERAVLDAALSRARDLEPEIRVTVRVREPPAAKALVEASEGAQLLVVGSRGLRGFNELAIGSVSNECAHHSRCPVVIIRPEAHTAVPGSPGPPPVLHREGHFLSGKCPWLLHRHQ
jgi:nucleotide-binding universal stress UspA family protein